MASVAKAVFTVTILIVVPRLPTASLCSSLTTNGDPVPTPWPHQFHSILVMNYSGTLQLIDLWYDWTNGRNINIIQHQLGSILYDLEWNNGTSFFYTLDSTRECKTTQIEVGILRPNWLDGAEYLGQRHVDGFLCNVWEKAEFISYYEDVVTKRPVHWVFYTGREAHVMTFEVGAVLEDAKWQAPVYCFVKKAEIDPEAKAEAEAEFSIASASMDGRSLRAVELNQSKENQWIRNRRGVRDKVGIV